LPINIFLFPALPRGLDNVSAIRLRDDAAIDSLPVFGPMWIQRKALKGRFSRFPFIIAQNLWMHSTTSVVVL
jgi:hypothetical protein